MAGLAKWTIFIQVLEENLFLMTLEIWEREIIDEYWLCLNALELNNHQVSFLRMN